MTSGHICRFLIFCIQSSTNRHTFSEMNSVSILFVSHCIKCLYKSLDHPKAIAKFLQLHHRINGRRPINQPTVGNTMPNIYFHTNSFTPPFAHQLTLYISLNSVTALPRNSLKILIVKMQWRRANLCMNPN